MHGILVFLTLLAPNLYENAVPGANSILKKFTFWGKNMLKIVNFTNYQKPLFSY